MKLAPLVGPLLVGTAAIAGVVATFVVVRQSTSRPAVGFPAASSVSTALPEVAPPPEAADATPVVSGPPTPLPTTPSEKIAGTYRCWSFNVGGSGSRCTSPPIVLNANGTYTVSSERGRYTLSGDQLVLSESKIRGPGTLSGDRMRMTFEYTSNGLAYTVTYLKQEAEAPQSAPRSGPVYLDLTIRFDEPYDGIDGITAVQLVAPGGGITYEALAYATDGQTLKAYFKPSRGGVPGGAVYHVYLSFVNERVPVGQVDLRNASGEVSRTIRADLP